MIATNLETIRTNIKDAAQKANRDPRTVTTIAVTKFANVNDINQAIKAGITDIGENRVQNAKEKLPLLEEKVKTHLIGSLQTNKVKPALELFDLIHSVDRWELVEALAKQAGYLQKPVEFLIQVNISKESSKHGLEPYALAQFIEKISVIPGLVPAGLMTIAPLVADPEMVRPIFRQLKRLFNDSASQYNLGSNWRYLSMGMSQDYQVAVEEGANLVRIGTAIFKPE